MFCNFNFINLILYLGTILRASADGSNTYINKHINMVMLVPLALSVVVKPLFSPFLHACTI